MNEERRSKNVWGIVLKVIITVATAIAGALGLGACSRHAHDYPTHYSLLGHASGRGPELRGLPPRPHSPPQLQ